MIAYYITPIMLLRNLTFSVLWITFYTTQSKRQIMSHSGLLQLSVKVFPAAFFCERSIFPRNFSNIQIGWQVGRQLSNIQIDKQLASQIDRQIQSQKVIYIYIYIYIYTHTLLFTGFGGHANFFFISTQNIILISKSFFHSRVLKICTYTIQRTVMKAVQVIFSL